jgi:hypothetical protein
LDEKLKNEFEIKNINIQNSNKLEDVVNEFCIILKDQIKNKIDK